ncbi:hypothetical protein ACSSS7_002374 [Eimeria intestinalis]
MDADGFQAVRRRRGPRKAEAMPYEAGQSSEENAEALARGALMHAGSAAAEEEAAALLRRVDPSDANADDEEEESEEEEEGGASPPMDADEEGPPSNTSHAGGGPSRAVKAGGKRNVTGKRAARKSAISEKEQQEQPFIRRLPVPQHRYTPLKQQWVDLIKPLILHMKLQVRMNLKRRCVELRAAPAASVTSGPPANATAQLADDNTRLGKGADYIRAFLMGFEQRDCVALLRLEDMYLETFEIQDVKKLTGAHFSRLGYK